MRKTRLLLILLLLTLWVTGTIQAASEPAVPPLDERVRELVLDNGLRVVVVERHNAPVFFTLSSFRVGSCQESPDHSGLSHFLEHMLFKGTETIGTTDRTAEIGVMAELEEVATNIRDIEIILKEWRFEQFDEYANQIKVELPDTVREQIGTDEAAGLRAVLEQLPTDIAELPEQWRETPWILTDNDHNYWELYRHLIEHRAHLVDLMAQQREYVSESEPLSGIYEVHGAQRCNAFTSNDQTTYMVGLPTNCLELWMYMESDRFQNPVFREFYSERNVVLEEANGHDNEPWLLLHYGLIKTAFQAHPYGRPVIGWKADIRRTLRSDMEQHFQQYYAPNNCQITIVGDVDTDEVFQMMENYFGSWEASEVAEERLVREPEQNGERRVMVEYDAEPQLQIGYHAPVYPHPDAYALTMMDYILSSGRTSRFYRSIFEDQQLTASAPWCGSPDGRYDELFTIGATPKAPHTAEEVETAIYAEIDKLKSELVTEYELERIRNQFRVYQLGRLRSNLWLAFTLSSAYVNQGDWRTITEEFNRLMEVTPEDIQRVANKYFTARNRTVAILIKPPEQEDAASTIEVPQVGGQ